MKKFFKKAAVVGLAGALGLTALAGCGGGTSAQISVYIFAGEDDVQTNTDLCKNWAEKYKARMIEEGTWTAETAPKIDFDLTFEADTTTYFTTVRKKLVAKKAQDIFYVSPKYVKAWARQGLVLDLSKYIDFDAYDVANVWSSALGFYGYDSENGIIGDALTYDTATKTFKNSVGGTAGVYGLPKDLSSFGMAYNANFFTDAMKQTYATTSAASFGDTGVITTADGKDAKGIINVGETITYKPYNFYVYPNYAEALAKGDPVAVAADKNGGYDVTIPGYPGETFVIPEADRDQGVAYDNSIGYITYTYAEYSAVSWATCYTAYKTNPGGKITNAQGTSSYVYGNDIYEGTLYLLPWLYGNDADFISSDYKSVMAANTGADWDNDGTKEMTGINSENFIETYAAFLAYTSDWNANSYYAGDGNNVGGWTGFNGGYVVFYGCGTWDMPSLNDTDKIDLDYQLMPEPIGESYALNSRIKDAEYKEKHYGATQTSFTAAEIEANQVKRQNQWACRIDSVGYGANGQLESLRGTDLEWKIAAVADLVANLTIDEDAQVQLTYAGSQLPNYSSQCNEYVYYMSDEFKDSGAFKYMITPDNTADNLNPNNPVAWDDAYAIAKEIKRDTSSMTVKEWFAANYPNYVYNKTYENYSMKDMGGISIAMRALHMISYDYASRNLLLRMASTNGVKDAAMYTYNDSWMGEFTKNKVTYLVAYCQQTAKAYENIVSGALVEDSGKYYTPKAYCEYFAPFSQEALDKAIAEELDQLG